MKKKLVSLLLALVMCMTLCIPAFANEAGLIESSRVSQEEQIRAEIQKREEAQFNNIYEQLKAQDALKFFDAYKRALRPGIEASVRAEFGEAKVTRDTTYDCPHGAVLVYYDPVTRCNMSITYLNKDDTSAYVMDGAEFSAETLVLAILGVAKLPASLAPFAYVLAAASIANSLSVSQIKKADGYAMIINAEDPVEGSRASTVGGWRDHTSVTVYSNFENVSLTKFKAH